RLATRAMPARRARAAGNPIEIRPLKDHLLQRRTRTEPMLRLSRLSVLALGLSLALGIALASLAQAPKGKPGGRPQGDPKEGAPSGAAGDDLVARLMAFDKNGDGKLTKEEITDRRLLRLFEQADANKDGTVTKEELTALAAKIRSEAGAAGEE